MTIYNLINKNIEVITDEKVSVTNNDINTEKSNITTEGYLIYFKHIILVIYN